MPSLRVDPRTENPFDVADFLEARLLEGPVWRVTEANARRYLESKGLGETYGPSVPGAVVAMHRRARRLGSRYPFEASPGGLKRASTLSPPLPYTALLCLSQASIDTDNEALIAASQLFEQLCEAALTSLGGSGASVLHFGWPNRSGRPEAFAEAIRWLAVRLNLTLASGYRDPKRRDGGVDLVIWRSLADGRTFDHRLVQCTVGHSILAKAREVDVQQWQQWITFGEGLRVSLVVPHQLAERSVEVRQAQQMGTLVLDRLATVSNLPEAVDATLRRRCVEVIETFGLGAT